MKLNITLIALALPMMPMAYSQSGTPARYADQVIQVPNGQFQQGFGYRLDMENEWLAVVNRLDDTVEGSEGSVSVFRRSSTGYSLFQELYPDPAPNIALALGTFGVDVKGSVMVVAATRYPNLAGGYGAAYVFEFDGQTWVRTEILEPLDSPGVVGNGFGVSVAVVDSQTILVGALSDPVPGPDADGMRPRFMQEGAVYVFQKSSAGWAQTQKIKAHFPPEAENFDGHGSKMGISLTVGENSVAVGLRQNILNLNYVPMFHITMLERNASGYWSDAGPLKHPTGNSHEEYGYSIAIEGDLMAVGAPVDAYGGGFMRRGWVYLYRKVAGQWQLEDTLEASDGHVTSAPQEEYSDRFGERVSISNGRVLVGAKWAKPDFGPIRRGAAYLFEQQNGVWTEIYRMWTDDMYMSNGTNRKQRMGKDVALHGSTAIVSDEFGFSGSVWGAGSVHVFFLPFGEVYCQGVSNSTGSPAWIEASGSTDVSVGHLNLRVGSLPQGLAGYLLAGSQPGLVSMPGGSLGNLCLGGTLARFQSNIQVPDSNGVVNIPVDMNSLPTTPTQAIQAGQNWHFQYWYRDSVGGPVSNFSDAVGVEFQ